MDTLTIHHQDGALVHRMTRGGYCVRDGTLTVSVEAAAVMEDQFPERVLFALVDAPLRGDLRAGMAFEARTIAGETVEGRGIANAYFTFHADDVFLRWTVREVATAHTVFALDARHDDVEYYDEKARRTASEGVFALSPRPRTELWIPG